MSARADNKDGSCREILKGRLVGQWRVQFAFEDEYGRKRRLSRLFPTKTAGKDFLRDLKKGARIEEAKTKKELTLGVWFDWLAENDWPESLDAKTIAIRKGRFNKYVRKDFGNIPLTKIDSLVVRAFYRKLKAEGVGQSTIHGVKANLVRVFTQAVSPYGRVPTSLANPFCLTLQSIPLRDAVAIAPDAAAKAIRSEKLTLKERAMLATFLLAGLRLAEQMALTKEQLLFDQGLIAIDRAVKLGAKGEQSVGLPKGNKKRLAVMCPTLRMILSELSANLKQGDCLWPAEGKNHPRMKRSVYRTWQQILKKAELPEDMSPHDCRLSHINWIEKLTQISSTTLKEHVGHAAGQTVTEINYTRPLSASQALLACAIEEVVFPPASQSQQSRLPHVAA